MIDQDHSGCQAENYRGPAVLPPSASLAQQPQNLPPRPFVGLFGGAMVLLEFDAAQMRLEEDVSGHTPSLQPPMPSWYSF
jgi:hypothetical protein